MTFSEIATDLDARLTVLENYQSSLEAKGCPRASCGVSGVTMETIVISNPVNNGTVSSRGFSVAIDEFVGTDTPVAYQVEVSTTSDFSNIFASKESEVSSGSGAHFTSGRFSPSMTNCAIGTYYMRGRWKGQSLGWGQWCTPIQFTVQ